MSDYMVQFKNTQAVASGPPQKPTHFRPFLFPCALDAPHRPDPETGLFPALPAAAAAAAAENPHQVNPHPTKVVTLYQLYSSNINTYLGTDLS